MTTEPTPTPVSITGLALLRQPFPAHQISKLPKPYTKDSAKGKCVECGGYHGLPAMHLDYVGHAALTDRLLDADPAWTWEPVAVDASGLPLVDKDGGMWIRLTVCGVTRFGYGDAGEKKGAIATKERIGDALRNAAMRFGAALDLWHKGDLHLDDETTHEAAPRQAQQSTKEHGSADANAYASAEVQAQAECTKIGKSISEYGKKVGNAVWAACGGTDQTWSGRLAMMRRAEAALVNMSKSLGEHINDVLDAAVADIPEAPHKPTPEQAKRAYDAIIGTGTIRPASSA